MDIEWSAVALDDLASLDRTVARRVKQAIERFADTGAGAVKRLQDINPPQFRLRVGDYRVRFYTDAATVSVLRVLHRREAYR